MRKSITLSLAVAGLMAFGASAVIQPENVKFPEKHALIERDFKPVQMMSIKAPASLSRVKAPAKISPITSSGEIIEGEYGMNTSLIQNTQSGIRSTHFGIYAGLFGVDELPENHYVLYLATLEGLLPEDGSVESLNPLLAIFDPEDKTLTIPAGQFLWEETDPQYGELKMGLYPAKLIPENGQLMLDVVDADIVYHWDGNQFILPETDTDSGWLWFGDIDSIGYGFFANNTLALTNLSGYTALNVSERNYGFTYYGWADVNDDKLQVRGMLGFSANTLIEMDIDRTNKTLTATEQVLLVEDDQYFYWTDDSATPEITATYEIKEEQYEGETLRYTSVSLGDLTTVVIDPTSLQYTGLYSKTSFNIFLDIDDTTAIDAIEAADNTNAPVEYFNLQGVRVNADNLNNGVYIRRQGSDVQKVMVK